jgi:signal transduction histidine kinase
MEKAVSKKAADLIFNVPWGTHCCNFYKAKTDLLDILAPYFKAGLLNNELCLWVTSKPLDVKDAVSAMRKTLPRFDAYLERGQIEIYPYDEWYLRDGVFNARRVLSRWIDRYNQTSGRGYKGMRLSGNAFRLEKTVWKRFVDYEEELDKAIAKHRIKALCTYPLDLCRAYDVIDVVKNHGFALIKRGTWELIENSQRRRAEEKALETAKAELEKVVRLRTAELEETNRKLVLEIAQRKQAEDALIQVQRGLENKVAERTRELSEANAKLQELDRLKSEFLATMSHELRTPLNSIIGFTGIVLQGFAGGLNEEQKKQLSMVYGSAKHLLGLINDILDLSKIESGKFTLSESQFQIDEVVSEVVQSLSPTTSQKGLKLVREIPPDMPPITSDRKRLFQILLNLVHNAVKFTEQGEIRIECLAVNGELEVSVADTGIGIKKENMEMLFESFRQIDGTSQRRYQGTGLGLYLCKKLVELLGGRIRAESEYGKGSRFTFVIPVERAADLRLSRRTSESDKSLTP